MSKRPVLTLQFPSPGSKQPAADRRANADSPRPDHIALSSCELVRGQLYECHQRSDAWDRLQFELMVAEDDCNVARHVVPFGSLENSTWQWIAAQMFEVPPHELSDTLVDMLVEQRGLFPNGPADGPRLIAMMEVEVSLAVAFEHRHQRADAEANARDLVLEGLPVAFDAYVTQESFSEDAWNHLSVTIFEQSCTNVDGVRFQTIFDRPDLTTGTAAGHARSRIAELAAALAIEIDADDERATGIDDHIRSLLGQIIACPVAVRMLREACPLRDALLSALYHGPDETFGASASALPRSEP
ncbi:hypothetical protein KRZ98_16840 [Sphingobium sp. AS12]|uniref:hypothetical protein n=1 Tax=Sphingobium sp. AS12 TaxID=2849495 RepID=UPI001C3164F2|nr:hypothetical protein [Sphingobium sp. AS12]MBV2149913.1 hypothetical protein [Sphingobium sp. AS12]